MDRVNIMLLLMVFLLSSCVVRTYSVTKERIDQDLSGNRGYLKGGVSLPEKERKLTRTTKVIEVELYSPVKFVTKPKEEAEEKKLIKEVPIPPPEKTEEEVVGNRGYIFESQTPQIIEPTVNLEKYTVQKGDTLQKIAQKFYGTTRKWNKIYGANKTLLKSPDRVYPGQVLDIPLQPPKEPPENLK